MINAGTVAAYLTLDTSDFVKGISSAGEMLTLFRNEQSDGMEGLGAMLGGLGSLILEKISDAVGSLSGSAVLGALPDIMRGSGLLAAQGFMNGISGLQPALSGFGISVLGSFNEIIGSLENSEMLGTLPDILMGRGLLAAQGFMNGINGLQPALSGFGMSLLGSFNEIIGSLENSEMLGTLPDVLMSRGSLAAQGFMNGISGLQPALSGFGMSLLGIFNGIVGSLENSEMLAVLPAAMREKGALAVGGLIGGIVSQGGGASSAMSSIIGAVKSSAGSVSFVSVGQNIIGGVISGMNARRSSLMAVASGIASSISGVMRSVLKINSPSRVMMEVGEFTAAGMELGLTNGARNLYDTALHISRETAEVLSGVAPATLGESQSLEFSDGETVYDLFTQSESRDRLSRLIDAVERLAASQSTVEIDGRPFGRLVREYV